ncbi:bifunctional 4-hydroxy-2-oxoglutarate aldolase/2-dehydro-3-deoxy-phosphogluconate aldolase [Streptomyces sp. NBC_00513]|uniref:bifunctional 4-hydroxy-2-oxoglutarate aldolase/2-dehydro-3-deoxy-phosphogluconate aldolase n=1 Tax=unclassified Streptomyces TaxID=2593676 RepID=UPI002255687B|nr:bifunctional 4-hydroxy-2-oxoglutarate aldolase/2-dehydro-3-deoxy-phosphogluconate aldolase [Streptomyces sp. NBC_00424]MCX5078704.1 bifunctional 4-hydroxy-2-oxoglutarate aldolase/2-dehydro-3-deoxy-phosphogluconate aldolase [Streptomyces sp. NBC_00424]WUD39146.1 bifunctional 4-hydroxy-2-oxoglutarate aldolase/2-dehydro-3-deoxy-phosphogluconate aldolase [Streptomyces sp. NBC_00513]
MSPELPVRPHELLTALSAQRLMAIVRGSDSEAALNTVLTLVRSGVRLVEVSLSGADALNVIAQARAVLGPDALLGAGTVLTAEDARRAAEAGAAYVVTPAVTEAVAASRVLGLPVLAGALTPTEVVAALREGATAVKLFPAGPGGVELLRALRAPFPDVPFVPVGGVGAVTARECLAEGAVAVGVGGPLVGRAADGDPTGLAGRIAAFRTLAEEAS